MLFKVCCLSKKHLRLTYAETVYSLDVTLLSSNIHSELWLSPKQRYDMLCKHDVTSAV